MPTVTQHIRKRVERIVPNTYPPPNALRRTEWCREFENARINRKVIGAMRYGLMDANGKPKYDRVTDMVNRLQAYQRTRNAEHLVDVANLAELEFVEGDHKGIKPTDGGLHTKIKE